MSGLGSLIGKALTLGQKVAPNAAAHVTIAGAQATISFATLKAGFDALGKIPWDQIEAEFEAGQIVTAGVMAADDAVSVIDKFIPAALPAEKLLDFAVFIGTHSLAHNSGEKIGGIEVGRRPEGEQQQGTNT